MVTGACRCNVCGAGHGVCPSCCVNSNCGVCVAYVAYLWWMSLLDVWGWCVPVVCACSAVHQKHLHGHTRESVCEYVSKRSSAGRL